MSWKTGKKLAGVLAMGGLAVTGAADAQLKAIKTATSISPAERKQGTDAHPQLMAEFGGAYNGPQAAYVNRIGQNIAVQSGLSRSPSDFTVTLLNSPVNNAFAIPGGYVYVTRQLMALMNDEAELAGVLGHEVGHVAAQHSKKRQSAPSTPRIWLRVAQLATLGFSRSQELQAARKAQRRKLRDAQPDPRRARRGAGRGDR